MGRPKKVTFSSVLSELVGSAKEAGVYSPAMSPQYQSLAAAMLVQRKCIAEIDALGSMFIEVETRTGKKLESHPVFKTLSQATATIATNCKTVGLTIEVLSVGSDDDPLADLIRDVKSAGEGAADD